MRLWTWSVSGPDQPEELKVGAQVWDEDEICWELNDRGQWWPCGEPWDVPEDLFGFPMVWSVLLEKRGPLRNKPRQDAPVPTHGDE